MPHYQSFGGSPLVMFYRNHLQPATSRSTGTDRNVGLESPRWNAYPQVDNNCNIDSLFCQVTLRSIDCDIYIPNLKDGDLISGSMLKMH